MASSSGFKILGQEPAAIVGVVEAFLALLLSLNVFSLTSDQLGWIMAVVVAGLSLVTAYATKHTTLAAVVGFAKAAIVLGVGFGVPLDDTQTAAIIGFVTVVGGLFLRTQTASLDTAISNSSLGATPVTNLKEAVK